LTPKNGSAIEQTREMLAELNARLWLEALRAELTAMRDAAAAPALEPDVEGDDDGPAGPAS
jgi:hypothetical protein